MTGQSHSAPTASTAGRPGDRLEGRRVSALVTGGVPHPTRGASTVLMFHYLDALLAAGATVQCVLLNAGTDASDGAVAALRAAASRPDLLEVSVAQAGQPLTQHRFALADSGAATAERVRPTVAAFRPDDLLCFDIDAAAIGRHLDAARRWAWLGDLRFQTLWHHALHDLAERPHRAHAMAYALVQRRKWQRVYAAVLRGFAGVVASSGSSVPVLRDLGIASTYAPYPWPALPASATAVALPERPAFLFFGNLVGLGSRSSLDMLLGAVLPRLRRLWGAGGFAIRIAGRERLEPRMQARLEAVPEIRFLGFVDDLAAEIAGCHAVLAPVAVPVGNRSRILTALSVAAPVIAHANAALGNPDLTDGNTCWLAADADGFVARMQAAVERPEEAAAIGRRGRDMYLSRFAPAAAAGLFVDLLADGGRHSQGLDRTA